MKRLIICCDGTWSDTDQHRNGEPSPTNVIRLAYRVAKRGDLVPQIVHYDPGVWSGNVLDRFTGGAIGLGLEENIHDAYRFLVGNYELGDEIFLFGFSRGAYTARSVAGLIRKCGILRREAILDHYGKALDLYRDRSHPDAPAPAQFRRQFSLAGDADIPIKLIGVWDTVGPLGIPMRGLRRVTRRSAQFHDTELSGSVEHAYQALSIDEHRSPFAPALWSFKAKALQTIEQVWFCGAHSDVGGGQPERELSDIPLQWMLEKAHAAGLALDPSVTAAHPLRGSPFGRIHHSMQSVSRLALGMDREIGLIDDVHGDYHGVRLTSDPTQSLHESVRQRWDADPSYRPPTLRRYFERISDERV